MQENDDRSVSVHEGMRTTLFIPVRNEITGIQVIMPRINKDWVDEILVVDGNSTDGTREYFEERGYKVVRQKSVGICGAYWEGLEVATGDIIIAFSPDNNSIPELIPPLVEKMKEGYEMAVVSRYKDGAQSEDDDPVTALGNWRAFRKDLVERLGMDSKKLPVFEYQMSIRCAKKKCKVAEIPGDEPKRIGDIRKMHPIYNGLSLIWQLIKELFVRA
jgi:glycosyltransferase involved in cell wall biosynthesis